MEVAAWTAQCRLADAMGREHAGDLLAQLHGLYLPLGGTISGDQVFDSFRSIDEAHALRFARHLAAGEVFSFMWSGTVWLPRIQFDFQAGAVRAGVVHTLRELRGVFDGALAALWFARPHAYLNGKAPVMHLIDDPGAVLQAARVDRFIA